MAENPEKEEVGLEKFITFESFPFPFEIKPNESSPKLFEVDESDGLGLKNGWLISTVAGKDVRGLSSAGVIQVLAASKFPMKLGFSPPNDTPKGASLEEFGKNCLLIRNALTIEEQSELCDAIEKEQLDMIAAFGGACGDMGNVVSFDMSSDNMVNFDDSIPGKAIWKAKDFIANNYTLTELTPASELNAYCVDGRFYGENDNLFYHADNIKKANHVVFLYSLGRTANFYVHTPEMGGDQKTDGKLFEFRSGDLLFFDATEKAQCFHGIKNIGDGESCPEELREKFGEKRIGLQIRLHGAES